jgi:hypothetical protein
MSMRRQAAAAAPPPGTTLVEKVGSQTDIDAAILRRWFESADVNTPTKAGTLGGQIGKVADQMGHTLCVVRTATIGAFLRRQVGQGPN